MILNKEIAIRIGEAFDDLLEAVNMDREEGEKIEGQLSHEYYQLSIPRGKDPTSKYLVDYEKIEHFLKREYPDKNLSRMTQGDMRQVFSEMLEVYIGAHK